MNEQKALRLISVLNNAGVAFYASRYDVPDEVMVASFREFELCGEMPTLEDFVFFREACDECKYIELEHADNPRLMKSMVNPSKSLLELMVDTRRAVLLQEKFNDYSCDLYFKKMLAFCAEQERYEQCRKEVLSAKQKKELFEKYGYSCARCPSMDYLEIDHIVEIRDGGDSSFENLQLLCHECHREKTSRGMKARSKNKTAHH